MNGLKFFMKRRGMTSVEMAELTDLPEQQIREMMDEVEYTKPSHFYMRVSDVLDVPVELLIEQYPDDENAHEGGNGVIWEDWFERRPNTFCKIYLARITGPHAEYRFNRVFQHVVYQYSQYDIYCVGEDLMDGVYEVYARWYDVVTGEVVHYRRHWFVVYEDAPYELDEQDVLYTLFNLEAQKSRKAA